MYVTIGIIYDILSGVKYIVGNQSGDAGMDIKGVVAEIRKDKNTPLVPKVLSLLYIYCYKMMRFKYLLFISMTDSCPLICLVSIMG